MTDNYNNLASVSLYFVPIRREVYYWLCLNWWSTILLPPLIQYLLYFLHSYVIWL